MNIMNMGNLISSSSQSRLINHYLDLLSERTAALERRVGVDEIRQLRQENRELRDQMAELEEKCRGHAEAVLIKSSSETVNSVPEDESGVQFSYYVGYCWLKKFMVCMFKGNSDGDWCSLGISNESVFKIYYTQLDGVRMGDIREGEFGLYMKQIDLPGPYFGRKVFARVSGSAAIELCTASSLGAVEQGQIDNMMSLVLF